MCAEISQGPNESNPSILVSMLGSEDVCLNPRLNCHAANFLRGLTYWEKNRSCEKQY